MVEPDPASIDRRILDLVVERVRLAEGGSPEALAELKARAAEMGLSPYLVGRIFEEIADLAARRRTQRAVAATNPELAGEKVLRVAYEGIPGSYSEVAIRTFFSDRPDTHVAVSYPSIRAAFRAVESGECDLAMLPIEGTVVGSINETYDLLAQTGLAIVGEDVHATEHCLLAIGSVQPSHVRRIYSHPLAQQQCSQFLAGLEDCAVESVNDTAAAAKRVSDERDLSHAAIAGEEAARAYGLTVIKRAISDSRENHTRFVLVGRKPLRLAPDIPAKTSMLLVTAHRRGALVECLSDLAAHDVNMTKLESRQVPGAPWEYMFYIDIEGNSEDINVRQAIDEMRKKAVRLRVLGTYPDRVRQRRAGEGTPEPLPLPEAEPDDAGGTTACPIPEVPFKLASLAARPERSVYRIRGVTVGEGFVIIAGPCAVESRDSIMECARIVRENGGSILRGGAFKPRTSPYSFQGLGEEGLEYLAEAGARYRLPVVTEVVEPEQVRLVAARADILQIGARNMQNFALLREVGLTGRPVFLKRGMMASIEEWLLAAEYVLAQGNQQVILCERGIRSFDRRTRNTLDISAVPVARSLTHLPVFVDPSHACGVREWVPDLALAAAAVRADGIMVEIHPRPDEALCDRRQALSPAEFRRMVAGLERVKVATS